VGTDVNVTMLFTTLQVVRFEEDVRTTIRLRRKPINLCVFDSEERVRGVGIDVNDIMLMMTGADLLDGGANTSTVSQRSEAGQTILCVKEDIGKYGMWYGVVWYVRMSCRLACRTTTPLQEVTTRCHVSSNGN
jgi:hypothetical protein